MADTSTLERVARAMGDKHRTGYDENPRLWIDMAEDALRALREPSAEIVAAGKLSKMVVGHSAAEIFRDMIDACLMRLDAPFEPDELIGCGALPVCPWDGLVWPDGDPFNRDDYVDYLVMRANKGQKGAITRLLELGEDYRDEGHE